MPSATLLRFRCVVAVVVCDDDVDDDDANAACDAARDA